MIAGNHIIQNQSIEIEFEDPGHAMGLQNKITEVFYEKLQPRMEVLFDELFGENYFASIDKLEIDCGLLDPKNWEQEFTEEAIRKLKEELRQVNRKEIDLREAMEENTAETFFFFIENGFLPWNKRIVSTAELEQLLKIDKNRLSRLRILIKRKEKVAERIARQFSKEFTSQIIAALAEGRHDELDRIYSLVGSVILSKTDKQMDRDLIDAAILTAFASDEKIKREIPFLTFLLAEAEKNAELMPLVQEIVKTFDIGKEVKPISTEEKRQELEKSGVKGIPESIKERKSIHETESRIESEKPGGETIYVNNAGLILLHPFLPALYDKLNLTEENKWMDESSRHKAVLVSEFLATGNDEFEEFNLALNKILCGFDTDEIVDTEMRLDDEIKTECQVLLNDIIAHWKVLKNTGIEGLRETFIQRSGKLSKVDNGWLIQVEQKAVDILLSHLPWGIGLIKLPWMEKILYAEWT
jgi:hypothetical protein